MKQYDEDQEKAIEAFGGYYLVLAPPGCGKTDILAERIARARKYGVEFEDMLCLTFTNRASRGMRSRIMEKVGEDARNLFVGNIHRFCSKFLYANAIISEGTSVIDEDDQTDIFESFDKDYFRFSTAKINKNAVKYVGDLASYIKQCQLRHPAEVRYEYPESEALYELAKLYDFIPENLPCEKKALNIALRYLNYKEQNSIIDFEDILILAYEYMQHNEYQQYSWIQIDEVQDLNPLQIAIVDCLTMPKATVMYLGDEQQAIFSFMGAKLSLLEKLKKRCANHLLTLGNNYRSPEYILNVCNDYAEKELRVDPELLPTPVDKTPKEKFDLIITESETLKMEQQRILSMANYYLGLDKKERLAILVTKNDEADAISKTLTEAGVGNFKISGIDMFKTTSYKTLTALYSVLVNDFNFVAWARLLYGIKAIRSLSESRSLVTHLKSKMMTPSDLLREETYLQNFYRRYMTEEFVLFDTETTGLNVHEDEIVQIAAFKVRNGEKVAGSDFDIILETEREIPEMLGTIVNPLRARYETSHHYSRKEGLQTFLDYIGDRPVLGHNVTYDYLILQQNVANTLGKEIKLDTYDSLHIIKCVEPGLRRYKLEYLVEHLDLVGQNSHLANEDIEATKSLLDYCTKKMATMLPEQTIFKERVKVKNIIQKTEILIPLFDNIRGYLHKPVSQTRHDIAAELKQMHKTLQDNQLIKDLGSKFDTFIRYAKNEWVDYTKSESLFDQINEHIYDMTSAINEGDLVNSTDLVDERVFIMTVYKGKGLEFDNVVVLGAVDGTYPFYKINEILSNPGSTPEERAEALAGRKEDARKFYVALSRAKKRLCISYTRYGIWNHSTRVTPFIDSIKHHFYFFRGK